ncbi:MAG: hypothetical protein Kow0068_09350 [Marinilabiliales bacterium]
MLIDVMEIDAAQYASIAREMSENKSFLHVFHRNYDYLDKPPLLFWLSSISFILFGVSNFTYKLPSVIIALLGIYSTYRFTKLYYNKTVALYSAIILATSQAMFQMTNDIRTDTMLTGFIIFSTWQFSEYISSKRFRFLLFGSIGIGLAMLTKGPIGLIAPAIAIFSDLLLKKKWRMIFHWKWIISLIIITIILIPMCYGLYTQFDLHPEKYVYGLQGPSGIKFFFWTQSFGRITGDIYWNNHTPVYYFCTTILWDFQPWVLLLIPAIFIKIYKLFKNKFKINENSEVITLFGFVLVFCMMSLSKYKLPHYIFMIFPFASIISAEFIYNLKEKISRKISISYFIYMHLFVILIFTGYFYIFPVKSIILPIISIFFLVINWIIFFKIKNFKENIVMSSALMMVLFHLFMSLHFYPQLLKYQSTGIAGKMVKEANKPNDMFYYYKNLGHALDFYGQRITPEARPEMLDTLKKGTWIYVYASDLEEIYKYSKKYKIIKDFDNYKVTELSFDFLLPQRRSKAIKKRYLLEKIKD